MAISERVRKTDGIKMYGIDFRDQNGRRVREVAGTTRTQAKKLLVKRLGEVRAGTYVHPKDRNTGAGPTFSETVGRFLDEYASQRPSDYYGMILARPKRYSSDRAIVSFRPGDFDALRHHLHAEGLGPSSIRKILTATGTVFEWARRKGLIELNPAARAEKPSEPHHKVRFLSETEWDGLQKVSPRCRRPSGTPT